MVEAKTLHGKTIKDYGYCEDCQMFFDLWKYGDIESAGHADCHWRYATEEELPGLVADCEEKVPHCPKCDAILEEGTAGVKSCPLCEITVPESQVVYSNCFEEVML